MPTDPVTIPVPKDLGAALDEVILQNRFGNILIKYDLASDPDNVILTFQVKGGS